METSRCAYKRNIILNSVCQANHFITQGNYKATYFENRLAIFRPIFVIFWVSDADSKKTELIRFFLLWEGM